MEVREVSPDEYIEARKVQSVAFDLGIDFNSYMANENDRNCRAVFEDGKICACLDYLPFCAMLNGSRVGMAGIGGVASLPEGRRKGYVRALFRGVLQEAKENGDTLSYLFPFSNVYYRQFGYESCMVKNSTTIPLSSFQGMKQGGNMRMYHPGENSSPIREAYERFALEKNFMLIRSEEAWQKKLNEDPYKNNRYVYVHYNAKNQADGYIIFASKKPAILVEELIWLNRESLCSILGFLGGFAGRCKIFRYKAPAFLNFRLLISEPYDVKSEGVCDGMGRIVDAARALKTLTIPQDTEKTVIQVKDDFLDWNNDTFCVYPQNGETQVERTAAAPDLVCDVRTLLQLLSGYVTLEDCLQLGSAATSGKFEMLARIFMKRTAFINDDF